MVNHPTDRGAAAVEFALLLPLLMMLLLGIVDFGRAYNAKVTVTHAAREGARAFAISGDPALAESVAQAAATGTPVFVTTTECVTGQPAQVTVTHAFSLITPLSAITSLAGNLPITSVGSMRCGG